MSVDTCLECGNKMKHRVENVKYDKTGINITLEGVNVYQCPKCGYRETEIDHIEELDKVIAISIAQQPERLTPGEIRFLRKYIGLNDGSYQMSEQAERLLRTFVLSEKPVQEYPYPERFKEGRTAHRKTFAPSATGWVLHG